MSARSIVIEQAITRAAARASRPLPAWLVSHLAEEVASTLDAAPAPKPPAPTTAPPRAARLTGRQQQIAVLFAQGLTNQEIASALHVTENTVKTQAKLTCRAMGAYNRAHAAALATHWGLVAPRPLPTTAAKEAS